MPQDDLLNYLEKYVSSPKILTLDDLSVEDKAMLPDIWLDILSVNGKKRIEKALLHWSNFYNEFEQVVVYLKSNLISIDLIHHGFGYCLLYGINSSDNSRILYYEGRNPRKKTVSPMIQIFWNHLPDTLKKFYDKFHNGWYYLASGSMGLSPVEDFFFLNEEDWGVIEELEEVPVNLNKTLSVYTNGMGGYVCLEFTDKGTHCLLWLSSKPPKLNLDFWPIVDSWTAIGFK